MKSKRARHQKGQIIERSGVYFVRYYSVIDGKRERVTARLCVKDAKHRTASCSAVRQIADAQMMVVNASAGANPTENAQDVSVVDFWNDTYLPWLEKEKRPSSVRGYKMIWKKHLEPHFKGRSLREYRTFQGSGFLSQLAATLSRNSLQHVKSLASAIFSGACARGVLDTNPWRDAKSLVAPKVCAGTDHYLLGEAEDVMNALVSRVDAQAVFALAFWLGLRPAEIAGLKWNDVDLDNGVVYVRRSCVNGVVEEIDHTKTPGSVRELPMIAPVSVPLMLWRQKVGSAAFGYVFCNRQLLPMNPNGYQRNVMQPLIEKAGLKWKSLYAARRGCGTVLTALTGDALAAMQVLGHRSIGTTQGHYVKASQAAGIAGLKLLEAKSKA
jgi:integrase